MCSTWSKTFLCSWFAREQLHQIHHRQPHMLTASKGSSKSSKNIYRRQPLLIVVLHGCSSGSSSVGNCKELWGAVECHWSCGELWGSSGAVGAFGAMGNLWICGCLCGCGGPLRLANFGVPWDCGGVSELRGASGAVGTCGSIWSGWNLLHAQTQTELEPRGKATSFNQPQGNLFISDTQA